MNKRDVELPVCKSRIIAGFVLELLFLFVSRQKEKELIKNTIVLQRQHNQST
jgi:hypothetical protein